MLILAIYGIVLSVNLELLKSYPTSKKNGRYKVIGCHRARETIFGGKNFNIF